MKVFFYLLFILVSLYANEISETEKTDSIEILRELKKNPKNYQLHIIENFSEDTIWEIIGKHTYLSSISLVPKQPESILFLEEVKLFNSENEKNRSLQIHANIEIPSRDKIRVKPSIKKFFPIGIPRKLSLWVYSKNLELELKLVLSQNRGKDIEVSFGKLNFHGWKKLEANVILLKDKERLQFTKREEYSLKEIQLLSTSKSVRSDFAIYLDQISVILENYPEYPGSEIPDGWWKE
jgi:hypothetical protein